MYYGYDMGRFSKTCYVYVFTAENLWRSAFINVIARASLEGIENFAKSLLPVPPSGCYKITWNGKGIINAVSTWIHI
jgi:hypothetical protein